MSSSDQLSEQERIELLARESRVGACAAKHNESGFRMAWENLRPLPLVVSVTRSHRGRHQGLLNERA
jgi:hypothetical protein